MSWYYFDGDKAVGPLGVDALRQLRTAGILTSETLVAAEGTDDWQSIDTLLGTAGGPAMSGSKPGDSGAMGRLAAGVGAIAGLEVCGRGCALPLLQLGATASGEPTFPQAFTPHVQLFDGENPSLRG